jgi:hypothetical protein
MLTAVGNMAGLAKFKVVVILVKLLINRKFRHI